MRADGFHAQSLESIADDFSCKKRTLRSSLSPEDSARRMGRAFLSDIDRREQQEALDSSLANMPPEMRDMCEQLMAGATPTTLARRLGISRRQMRRRLEEARDCRTARPGTLLPNGRHRFARLARTAHLGRRVRGLRREVD